MGAVLNADCQVSGGRRGLRVADASVMPTIPCGNTYLGCVMVAERIARQNESLGAGGDVDPLISKFKI